MSLDLLTAAAAAVVVVDAKKNEKKCCKCETKKEEQDGRGGGEGGDVIIEVEALQAGMTNLSTLHACMHACSWIHPNCNSLLVSDLTTRVWLVTYEYVPSTYSILLLTACRK